MSSKEFMRKEFTLNLDSLTDLEEFVRLLISKISADDEKEVELFNGICARYSYSR